MYYREIDNLIVEYCSIHDSIMTYENFTICWYFIIDVINILEYYFAWRANEK